MSVIRKVYAARAAGRNTTDPKKPMWFVASTERPDSYNDIVMQNWELDDFKANPVAPWCHNYSIPTIGRIEEVELGQVEGVEGMALLVGIQFDMEDKSAAEIAGKYARGYLNAVSVGFSPLEWQYRWQLEKGTPHYAERGVIYRKSRLLEVSPCVVPANADATALRSIGSPQDIVSFLQANPQARENVLAQLQLSGAASRPQDPISTLFGVSK
jgi:hypothetical protein